MDLYTSSFKPFNCPCVHCVLSVTAQLEYRLIYGYKLRYYAFTVTLNVAQGTISGSDGVKLRDRWQTRFDTGDPVRASVQCFEST